MTPFIGTNPCIPVYRNNFEAFNCLWHAFSHRAAGVVHFAVGLDPYLHLDSTVLEPTVFSIETGEVIVKEGFLTILNEQEIKREMESLNITPSRW